MNYKFFLFGVIFISLIFLETRIGKGTIIFKKPEIKLGAHFTAWSVGDKNFRNYINSLYLNGYFNTIVIAIKEICGRVFIPAEEAIKLGSYIPAVRDFPDYLRFLDSLGVYTIARQVIFKDNILPRKRNELAVKNKNNRLWTTYKGYTWADPYKKEVWDYNLEIAKKALQLGFDEIQFDYIRFPSDGSIKECVYSEPFHSSHTAVKALLDFLDYASLTLKPYNKKISVCLFGLTPSSQGEMGIGQSFKEIVKKVDFVCLMIYPSHYNPGEYGLKIPEISPYKIVYFTLKDAISQIGGNEKQKIRPYLQSFSLRYIYDSRMIKSEIDAACDLEIKNLLFWDNRCRYRETIEALKNCKVLTKD